MKLVGRQAQVERLRSVLEFKNLAAEKMTILGIEGPGGVGKSSLITMAESGIDYKTLHVLRVSLDSTEPTTTLIEFVERLTQAIKFEAGRNYSRADIVLKETENATAIARQLLSEAQEEVSEDGDPTSVTNIFHKAVALGKQINKISKKSKDWVDFEKVDNCIQQPDLNSMIFAFQEELPKWWNTLGIGSESKNLRNAIRQNAAKIFAATLAKDIEAILYGYKIENIGKPMPSKISDCDRLLLVIDDFESISEISAEFLARYFLPKLKDAMFQSVVVISGRDDLTATNPSWNQHLQVHLLDPSIDVGPLSRAEIDDIARDEGVDAEVLWRDTDGYPYFIQLWIEANRRGGETALSLKKFYDRTTRWMTDQQKTWLNSCVFIDDISIDSIFKLTDSQSDAATIFSWFEMEGSIRDTSTKCFTVRSYVRGRILEYLRLRDPSGTSAQEDKARRLGVLKEL